MLFVKLAALATSVNEKIICAANIANATTVNIAFFNMDNPFLFYSTRFPAVLQEYSADKCFLFLLHQKHGGR